MENFQNLLNSLGIAANLCPGRTLTSAVTTAWGVEWDEEYIARDLMQNFYDANRTCLRDVKVEKKGSHVVVSAPTPFNLDRLFYLGSEKDEDDVGQYGEGFKAAAACLLRDHQITPIALSGRDVVVLRVANEAVANTKMYPVEYDFYVNDQPINGSILILPGCSRKMASAMARGLTHFLYEANPLLGERLAGEWGDEFMIFRSSDNKGHVFYRNLKRGEFEDIPLVLVMNKSYSRMEHKISKDRDRNAFGEEVMALFFNLFSRYYVSGLSRCTRIVLEAAHTCFEKGHPFLREVAESYKYTPNFEDIFGNTYYARSTRSSEPAMRIEIDRVERAWRGEGRKLLPGYFTRLGVTDAYTEIKRREEKARDEVKNLGQRLPTAEERKAISLLSRILTELAPDIAAVFKNGKTSYTVAHTGEILGILREGRAYRSREVFLAAFLFVCDFADALATFLHEHAHIFGHDGSRGFSDALTRLIETTVRHRDQLDDYDAEWKTSVARVQRERAQGEITEEADELGNWLSSMSEDNLRTLVSGMPTVALRKLKQQDLKRRSSE